jgi:glycosyltransferase involved in cell wall biosynthesis
MKIALYHDLPSGGAKRAVYETVRRLVNKHAIDVYTLSTANQAFCDLRPLVNQHYVHGFRPLSHFQRPFGRLNQLQRWRDLHRLDTVARQVAREIDEQGYDVVFVHPSMWTQAPTVLKYLHTKSLYQVQEPLRSVYEPLIYRPYMSNGWRKQLDRVDPLLQLYYSSLRATDRLNIQQASLLLANSKFTADNLRRIYGRHAEVAYFGVDTTAFAPREDVKRDRMVLSVGAIGPNKGFDFLIDSLALIPKLLRPPLLIIGNDADHNEKAYLIQLAQRHDVTLSIETMVSQDTLVQRYNQALIVVYAPIREPFGLVPLEAMACGTPVVSVAEGGVCETVVDDVNGLLLPRDPAQFAGAVRTLLGNTALRTRLGQQAREYVLSNWTWDRSAQQIEQYLCRVAKGERC